ncbi:MAG: TPM domain-containing protein [Chthoniobacterales bacterium]
MNPGSTGVTPVVRGVLAGDRLNPAQRRGIAPSDEGRGVAHHPRTGLGAVRFRTLVFPALFALTSLLSAAEVIPPKPDRYFNDYAHVVPSQTASQLNEQLAQFERETSNQVLVAVYPNMQTDSDIADYTQRIAQSWGVGQKDRRNGAVLFVFVQDRKIFIQVGYGLESVLPDITAFDISENRIKPRFRANDYAGGLAVGVDSITKAIRGEYTGTGRTVRERSAQGSGGSPGFLLFFFIFIIALIIMGRISQKRGRRGYRYSSLGGPFIGGWSGGSGGGWSSGGGGGGFSGFSGGGGSFGGGGAGSSW